MSAPAETKPPVRNRKQFVRTRVPRVESIAGAIILLLLVFIGISIYRKGQRFDPNLYNVRTEALKSTAEAVEGKAGTAPTAVASAVATRSAANPENTSAAEASSGYGEAGMEGEVSTPVPAVKGEPLEIALPGIKPMGDTEFYNSDNLYEKIDGRAPAYQSFNVQQLRCRSFSVNAAPGSYVDVYEYKFGSPVDAFGMFALERDPKGQPLDFAPDGYSGEMGWFFRQGAVYVQIMASDQKPATLAVAKAIAQNRAKELPVDDKGLAGRRKLPSVGLISDSVTYVPENAQGQAALKDVFQAKYKFDGEELPFFVMMATPEEAAKAWKAFHDFCGQFGSVDELSSEDGAKVFKAQIFGKWKFVYQREGELGGVFDATNDASAQAFVEKYLRGELK